jgi:gliding motility-associated-like protein
VTETHNKAIRGCKPGEFVFNVTPPSADTLVVHYQITGTAVNGYDYQTIADSVVFQPFQASDTLMIYPQGVPPTGPKTVELRVYAPYTCNGQQQIIDSVTMTIYDSVKVHILTSDTTVCNGDSVNVIASADSFLIYYNWTPNIGIVYDTVLSPRIGPPLDTAIMYVITALSDSAYGCKSTDSILIRTRTIKIDSVTVTPSSCNACDGTMTVYGLVPGEQDTLSLTINGNPLTPVPVVADTNGQAVLTGLCPGIYTNVFANYGLCKSDTLGDTIITVQLAANGMSFTNPTKCGFCDGTITLSNITLSTVDTVTYTIDGVTNAVQGPFNVTAGGSIVLAGLCAGNYSNIVIHSGFCTSVAYGPFTLVNPAIVINNVTTSNPSACGVCDGTIVLNGLPETQFDTTAWQFNGVWQPYIVFPVGMNNDVDIVNLCAGTYDSIVIHTNHGCSITEVGPYTLTGPSVGAGFSYNIHYSCKGTDTVVFQNQSNPIAPIHVRWHFGDNTMDTTANPSHVYDTEGVYQVTQYVSNLNCTDSLTQTVDTRHPIAASFTVNPSDTLCQGSMVTFTNTSIGGNPQYWWHFGDESVTDSIDFNPPGHFYLNAGTYHVLLVERDTLGCIDSAHANLVVDPIGGASITASDTNICAGQQITFHANYTKNGSTSITWDMGDGYSISNLNPVTHAYQGSNLPQSLVVTLNVTNRICPDTSAQQTIHVMPYPAINLGMDTAMCPGSAPITLADQINIGNPLASWHWNTGETTPSITVNQPGLYYSTVTLEGCSNSDSVLVANDCYIAVPNVFTPNGDGVNDYFFPRQFLTSGATNFSMEIYNRWGQQIFSTTNTEGQGWDGKFNGVIQPEGVYIYIIDVTFKDGKHEHHQGNVTLMK